MMAADKKPVEKPAETKPASGKKKKIIIIGAVVAVVLAAAGTGAFLMLGSSSKDKAAGQAQGADNAQAAAAPATPPAYMSFAPAFVVNFQPAEKVRARFLSVEMDAVADSPDMIDRIKVNMPAIRNSVIMLLSRQTYADLIKPEGKEKLRGEVLTEVQKTLQETMGNPGVKEIYFTSFVMQ